MWEDECFDEIEKGDLVYYKQENGSINKSIAHKLTFMGWILKNNVTVNDNDNYCGHSKQEHKTCPD